MENVSYEELAAFAGSALLLSCYGYRLMFEVNATNMIHYSLSCAVATSQLKKGGMIPFLVLIEVGFRWRKRNVVFFAMAATHLFSEFESFPFLFYNSYVFFSQLRHEFRNLGSFKIDPIFKALIAVFSEIIKFASLVNAAWVAHDTKNVAPFLFCLIANIGTTNRDSATSTTLLVHSATMNVPLHIKLYWATLMVLNASFSPLHDFSIVSEYLIDAAFFMRIWYF